MGMDRMERPSQVTEVLYLQRVHSGAEALTRGPGGIREAFWRRHRWGVVTADRSAKIQLLSA